MDIAIAKYVTGHRSLASDKEITQLGTIEASTSFHSGFSVRIGNKRVEEFPPCQYHDDPAYWAVRDDAGRLRILSQTGCGAGYDQFTGDVLTYKVFGPYVTVN